MGEGSLLQVDQAGTTRIYQSDARSDLGQKQIFILFTSASSMVCVCEREMK